MPLLLEVEGLELDDNEDDFESSINLLFIDSTEEWLEDENLELLAFLIFGTISVLF